MKGNIMKKLLILILLLLAVPLMAQINDGLFLNSSLAITITDSLEAADDSLASRVVYWPNYKYFQGSVAVYGRVWNDSSNAVDITVHGWPLHNVDLAIFGNMADCGTWTIAGNDSTDISINLIDAFNNIYSKGFQLYFVPDSTGNCVRFNMWEDVK